MSDLYCLDEKVYVLDNNLDVVTLYAGIMIVKIRQMSRIELDEIYQAVQRCICYVPSLNLFILPRNSMLEVSCIEIK